MIPVSTPLQLPDSEVTFRSNDIVMTRGGLKKAGNRSVKGADRFPVSVHFAALDEDEAAELQGMALAEDLAGNPYYFSPNPGAWQHFRAWCIYFSLYSVFLITDFVHWFWQTTL